MAYAKTTWASGDVVTSAKLNNIENGIAGGGVLIVTDTDGTLDHTWQEIADSAFCVVRLLTDETEYRFVVDQIYQYGINCNGGNLTFETDSADGYPVYQQEDSPAI